MEKKQEMQYGLPMKNLKELNLRKELVGTLLARLQIEGLKQVGKRVEDYEPDDTDDSVEEILDNAYVNRSGVPLAMDIFKPKTEPGTELPVIVYIHGGGLVMGDRRMSRYVSKRIARRGYLVFSLEYRLVPRANICEELDDVCAGMDLIGRRLVDFDVDFTRVFLAAESAGAFLAIYVAAMRYSEALQQAIGYEPSNMVFKAVGLLSGMFYTDRDDPIGNTLSEQFYGDKIEDETFMEFMNPEHPEIINNLPPAFLVTSRGDFLNNYTLMYQKALDRAGKKNHMLYFGEEELGHAFASFHPDLPQSKEVLDRMLAFFEEAAKEAVEESAEQREKESENGGCAVSLSAEKQVRSRNKNKERNRMENMRKQHEKKMKEMHDKAEQFAQMHREEMKNRGAIVRQYHKDVFEARKRAAEEMRESFRQARGENENPMAEMMENMGKMAKKRRKAMKKRMEEGPSFDKMPNPMKLLGFFFQQSDEDESFEK